MYIKSPKHTSRQARNIVCWLPIFFFWVPLVLWCVKTPFRILKNINKNLKDGKTWLGDDKPARKE